MGSHFLRRSRGSSVVAYLLVFVLLICLNGCNNNSSAQSSPQADYNAAVQDAQTLMNSPANIPMDLTAVVSYNRSLAWENNVQGSRVLVATYISNQAACTSYNNPASACQVGQECPNYTYASWVTVVPDLKRVVGAGPTLLRIAQALGLPPPQSGQTLDNTCIVDFYVRPSDLFRPSPDPEVTDHESELAFPPDGLRAYDANDLVYSDAPCDPAHCSYCQAGGVCGPTDYKSWFTLRRSYIYTATTPYPWTGLGYTYDWANPTPPHEGVSEFVINAIPWPPRGDTGTWTAKPVSVFIKSMTWTRDYFQ